MTTIITADEARKKSASSKAYINSFLDYLHGLIIYAADSGKSSIDIPNKFLSDELTTTTLYPTYKILERLGYNVDEDANTISW